MALMSTSFSTTPHRLPPARSTELMAVLSSSAPVPPDLATRITPSTKAETICASATVLMGGVSMKT